MFHGPLQMSVIMMNLFAGPPIFRSALISVGEARALQLPSVYSDVKSPQYACCNTSMLAKYSRFLTAIVKEGNRPGCNMHLERTFGL